MAKKEFLGVDGQTKKPVRVAYPHLGTPRYNELKKCEEYGVTLLIAKTDTESINAIKNVIVEAAKKKFGPQVNLASLDLNRFKDADKGKVDGTPYRDEFKGHYLVNLSAKVNEGGKFKPQVIGADGRTILENDTVYGGCYCNVSFVAIGYTYAGKNGVSLYLRNVQFVRDGEMLGGGHTADEFAPAEETASTGVTFGDEL